MTSKEVTMEPEEVSVIVHGARGLKGRKAGRHKYSVIFGLGGKKYRTDVVKDPTGCPDWNEESTIKVYNIEDSVFFTVTEKDDVLGHLSFPLMSLQTTKGRITKAPLQPHKKCPQPQGELIYQLYISKTRSSDQTPVIRGSNSDTSRPRRGFAKLKHSLATAPILPHRFHKAKHTSGNKSSTLSNLNKKFSQSLHDLFNISRGTVNDDDDDEAVEEKPANGHLRKRAVSVNYMEEIGQEPELTAVTPSEGPTTGGTQLVIIGKHLGAELAEVTRLTVCGCDCLDTLEYESPMRLYCTTKRWKAGKGDIVIRTLSGGQHVLENAFTFIQKGPVIDDVDGFEESSTDPHDNDNGIIFNAEPPSPTPNNLTDKNMVMKSMPNLSDAGKDTLKPEETKKSLFIKKSNEGSDNKFKKKDNNKGAKHHARRSSESQIFQRDDNNRRSWSKAELVAEVKRLEEENKELKKDNTDMKSYIDKLVAKVLTHCPEVLAMADDDEKL
ncbi:uncharacterized protein LOC135472183 isoform X2 [Liolophura sinensis]|uniref:uncharacterized protein LOC135472183 isoform X2 n=1 Tax=Liolophura sinensis TaxID=3198878 RepID=UPI00315930EC